MAEGVPTNNQRGRRSGYRRTKHKTYIPLDDQWVIRRRRRLTILEPDEMKFGVSLIYKNKVILMYKIAKKSSGKVD